MMLILLYIIIFVGLCHTIMLFMIGTTLVRLMDELKRKKTPQELVRQLENGPALVDVDTPERI